MNRLETIQTHQTGASEANRVIARFNHLTERQKVNSCDPYEAILGRQKVALSLWVGSVSDDGPDPPVERRLCATDLLQSFIDRADQFCLRYRADDLFLNCAALKYDQIWNAPDAVA